MRVLGFKKLLFGTTLLCRVIKSLTYLQIALKLLIDIVNDGLEAVFLVYLVSIADGVADRQLQDKKTKEQLLTLNFYLNEQNHLG